MTGCWYNPRLVSRRRALLQRWSTLEYERRWGEDSGAVLVLRYEVRDDVGRPRDR